MFARHFLCSRCWACLVLLLHGSYVPIISKFTEEWFIRTLNVGLRLTLQITYMGGMTKAPAEHRNVRRWAGGKAGRLTKPVSAIVAENAYTAIRSSSGTAAVHTAGERCRCFQIPDSLQIWGRREEIRKMSLVPLNFEELPNPSRSHMSHSAKSWSYQYSIRRFLKYYSSYFTYRADEDLYQLQSLGERSSNSTSTASRLMLVLPSSHHHLRSR